MKNDRISKRERGLIKGALRRVFSRSDLRRQVIEACVFHGYTDPTRPRVKTWCICQGCKTLEPKSYMVVDHIIPVVPLDSSFEEMTLEELIDRLWCNISNLQALCESCHLSKSSSETKIRRANKKALTKRS